MKYEVSTQQAAAQFIAAVERPVRLGEVASAWRPALDQVWSFLRRHEALRAGGHNLFLYRHPARRDEPMGVSFGVQVPRAFEGEGEVRCVATPAGEVATTLHVGPYDALPQAHEAVHAWIARSGRTSAGFSWEIYGDWNDDPAALETNVMYLLA